MAAGEDAEEIIDPSLPVIDTHHHLFDRIDPRLAEHLGISRFLIDEYMHQIGDGHNVIATVAVEARAMYRSDGPTDLRAVGETEFLNGQAAMAASGLYGTCRLAAGIVGYADFRIGDRVQAVLEAHIKAAPERFKGIRQEGLWDEDPATLGGLFDMPRHVYGEPSFRRGFSKLAPLGLSFDAFVLSADLADVVELANRFPNTQIVLDHAGSPVGIGKHHLTNEYPQWKRDMQEIARCPNVAVKLGGLGSYLLGSSFYRTTPPPKTAVLVAEWKPYIEPTIEWFGADRCMFESNSPTDGSGSFGTVCNAYKSMTLRCSSDEKNAIFSGTARRVYRLTPG